MPNTTRGAIPYPTLATIPDVPADLSALALRLDTIIAIDDQGALASRPVSTAGSPGIRGRYYLATDQTPHVLYRDYGTGWDQIGSDARVDYIDTIRTGRVAAAGTISGGTGFTVNKTGTGLYSITFSTPFSAVPIVIATAETVPSIVNIDTLTINGFRALITGSGDWAGPNAARDDAFRFIATGIR